MLYTVEDIEEDVDFGCEERLEGSPVMAVVVLLGEDGRRYRMKIPDQLLYDRHIDVGSRLCLDLNDSSFQTGNFGGLINK